MKAFKAFAQKGIYMEEVCYYSEKEKAKTFIKEWFCYWNGNNRGIKCL